MIPSFISLSEVGSRNLNRNIIDGIMVIGENIMNSRVILCIPSTQKLDYLVQHASGNIHSEIDNIYAMIVSCLKSCSDASIPKIKAGSLKFWWDQELDELKSNSVMSFRAWQNAGKPRDGPLHAEMTKQRLRYRKGIRDKETESNLVISNDLHECLIRKDFKTFWNCLKNKCGQKANRNISIEGFIDEI